VKILRAHADLPQKIHSFSTTMYLKQTKHLAWLAYAKPCISLNLTPIVPGIRALYVSLKKIAEESKITEK
jgi:hypothetical protein